MNELNTSYDAANGIPAYGAHGVPEITPELIEYHVRRARRLRSKTMGDGLARAAVAIRDGIVRLARRRPVGRQLRRAH